jgi:hypothetical protein
MNRSRIIAAIATSVFLSACSSGRSQNVASPAESHTSSPLVSSPTVVVQTSIPDGTYRTRSRTEQDLIALGLTKDEIAAAKKNERWTTSIVYELRLFGGHYLLVATSDGGVSYVADAGTFTVDGSKMVQLGTQPPPCEDDLRFSWADGVLSFKLLNSDCDDVGIPDFLYRAAYEALPFKLAS